MSLDSREPVPVWDAFNIDLLVRVAEMTFLNPLFAMWVPIITMSQRYALDSTPLRVSFLYLFLVAFRSLLSFSSHIWTNRAWRSKSLITSFFSGPCIDWDNQIIVVTGGASGIGQVLTETLAVLGATVVVIDKKEYVADWDDVYSFQCDLADPKAVSAVVTRIQEEVGHPTMLVNNAGVVHGKLLPDLTEEDIRQTFDVNVIAQFALIRAFLPEMLKAKKGHIVTVASVLGLQGVAQLTDYCASKHALIGLHESLKYELRYRHGDLPIRTTLVLPGHVRTHLFSSIRAPSPLTAFLAPSVEPHTVAKAVIAALDTDQSREIYLPISGGWVWAVKGLPSWAKDALVWFSGANDAMTTFAPGGPKLEGVAMEKKGE